MTSNNDRPEPAAEWRRQAEAIARKEAAQSSEDRESRSPEGIRQVLHELQVHQIELEMQNEELRRTQVELDAARARYFDLYDLAPVGYCTLSEKGLILEANLTAATLLGVARGALVQQPISRFICPEDQDRYYRFRQQLVATGAPQACELRMRRADAAPFWARLEATVAPDAAGAPGCRVVLSDITERRQLEEAQAFLLQCGLPATGEDFFTSLARYLAETLGMAYVCIDRLEGDGLIAQTVAVYNEGQFESNVRYALKDTPCGEVMDQRVCCYPQGVRQLFPRDAALQDLKAESYFGTTLLDSKGRPIGLIAVIGHRALHDPKRAASLLKLVAPRAAGELERRQVEEAVRESEERHRTILQTAMDGFWLVDPDGRLLEVNETYCRMSGYSARELLALRIPDLETAETADVVAAHIQKIMAAGEDRFESRHRRQDGSIFDVEVSVQYQAVEGGRLVVFLRDITDRKRAVEEREKLQARLNQAQKMESVGRLAGGVAHDFNNMLGVILGYAEMALEQVDPTQPLHASLEEIRICAQRSAELTRQLLAFARKQTVAPKVLDLNETVAGMLVMLERLIGENIQLTWQPKAELWPVKVDPSQIDQILTNLCVNARDAIAGAGKVTIETGTTTFDEAYCAHHAGFAPGEYVWLAVSDDGYGTDQETLAHIFEPFFTTKGVGKGTGLGLATVYGVVKQNNGFVNVYSEPGQGTTFTIYLPRQVAKAGPARTEGAAGPAMRGQETILLVEDEPALLEMGKRMLESYGYRVLAAGTPDAAIRLAEEHAGEIHLLVTDVVMPEMSGRDLAKNLLSLYPHLKRLFMSGYTANVIAHHGVLDEGVQFIQKPFPIKGLAAKVREVLDYGKD